MKFFRESRYRLRRNALILLVVGSGLSILLTPLSAVKSDVMVNLPWVAIGALITESLFIIGLGLIALEAGHELGRNPLRWRKKLHHAINQIVNTKLFWIGFWINATGALGTAIIVGLGIIKSLPPQSWGLLWLPAADLVITVTIRAAAIIAIEEANEAT